MIKNTRTIFSIIFCTVIFFSTSAHSTDETLTFKEYLEQANEYIKAYRHFEAGDALKKATELGGKKHPSLHMRLAILYYGLGLIPEAITEGETAVTLAPSSKWYKYDLAKFYYVDKQYDKAEQQFMALLKLDPGFTLGYYYLGELYFRKKEYDLAWLSMRRSQLLGHQGKHLENKLLGLSSKPSENISVQQEASPLFRFIKTESADQAQEILKDIRNGKLFENLELEMKKDKSPADFGVMMLSELKDSIADSLRDSVPYSPPVVVKTGPDYRIMQRILPFSPEIWANTLHPAESPEDKVQIAAIEPTSQPVTENSEEVKTGASPGDVEEKEPTATMATDSVEEKAEEPMLFSSKIASLYTIENWKEAWESQDVQTYLNAYSTKFTPPTGMTYRQWKEKRTRALSRPKAIKVSISDQVVETLSATQLLITFKQDYRSDSYQDSVVKTLTLEKENEGWKIVDERVVRVIN